MSKKWIGVLVGIWIIAAICGTTYFNLVKKDKGIKTIAANGLTREEKPKEKVVVYIPRADGK